MNDNGAAFSRHLPVMNSRPRTRRDCLPDGPNDVRPCLYITCKWNLFAEVSPATGDLHESFPGREPEEMAPEWSCALDVAERGGATCEEIGAAMNLTRQRIQQIEEVALRRSARHVLLCIGRDLA